jgi:crotonobetainyl-CoA:carnitine CoA-transferase CaiB-like acyl-CoA transferase
LSDAAPIPVAAKASTSPVDFTSRLPSEFTGALSFTEVSIMPGPMEGVRVVDLGFWVAGPSAAGILADWGAEVIKIEPPNGDPSRGFLASATGIPVPVNPLFELDNRGKRSIAINYAEPEGRDVTLRIIDRADVFISNLRPGALIRAGLDYESLAQRNPRLVYASVTAYGLDGSDRDRAAFDIGAFWSRSGIAASLTPAGTTPPYQRAAMGDHVAGIAAAAGVCAALLARNRTGRGQMISTSLLRLGIFALGWDMNIMLRMGMTALPMSREFTPNPMIACYYDRDGRWFWLLGLQGDRVWPGLARAVGHPEWLEDERFSNLLARGVNCAELIRLLDEIFPTRPLAEWAEIFDREGVWWAPVLTTDQVVEDPQAIACGAFVDVPVTEGSSRMVASPVDFSEGGSHPRSAVPELGQHTEEILLELGYDREAISRLKEKGAIP